VADDICSHGRPNHQDLIAELREAVGLAGPPLPITPQQAWEEAIAEIVALRAALATRPRPDVRDAIATIAEAWEYMLSELSETVRDGYASQLADVAAAIDAAVAGSATPTRDDHG
jgi:hypothetical protein